MMNAHVQDEFGHSNTSLYIRGPLMTRCSTLKRVVGEKEEHLDAASIKAFIDNSDLEEWMSILKETAAKVLKDHEEQCQFLRGEFKVLIQCSVLCFAESKMADFLEDTIEFFDHVNKDHWICQSKDLKLNNEAMITCCNKEDIEITQLMYKHGFRLASKLAYDRSENGHAGFDVMAELDILHSMTTAAYLLTEAKMEEADPVKRAFNHLKKCQELEREMASFSNILTQMSANLKEFTVGILGECANKRQVELFLAQDDEIEGFTFYQSSFLPRISQALELNNREFVTHDICQRVIREAFYSSHHHQIMKASNPHVKYLNIFLLVIGMPLHMIVHLLNKFGRICPTSSKSWPFHRGYQVISQGNYLPFNRLIFSITNYVLFLLCIMLTLINPHDVPGRADISIYDYVSFFWCLGYIFSDLSQMKRHTLSIKTSDQQGFVFRVRSKLEKCFSSGFLLYRLLSHIIYFIGMVLEYYGYRIEGQSGLCPIDDPRAYSNGGIVKLGICLQGVGVTLIITHFFQYLRLHTTIGSLYIAIRTCISIVFSFVITYGLVTFSFAVGLHFILKYSNEFCDDEGNAIELGCNNTFYGHFLKVRVYCLSAENPHIRYQCPKDCWTSWISNPTNKEIWSEKCRISSTSQDYYIPNAEPNDIKGGTSFGDLGEEKNRFETFPSTMTVLFWTLFDPGHPEVVGCSTGAIRYSALLLWILYNTTLVIILLNLLIALMNVAMTDIVEDRVASWKFHRCCRKQQMNGADQSNSNVRRYSDLIRTLTTKYMTRLESKEDVGNTNIENLMREIKQVGDDVNTYIKMFNKVKE